MPRIFCIAIILCASSALPESRHVTYTKYQREAAGFWRVTETHQGANVKWLVIGLGDSANTMTVRWPTGTGCQTEPAEIQANKITVVEHFPAVIQIQRAKGRDP